MKLAAYPPMAGIVSQLLNVSKNHYSRSALPALLSTSTAAGRISLVVAESAVAVGNRMVLVRNPVTLNLSAAASWDAITPTDYTVAANRAGKDFYLYALADRTLVLSANATEPAGHTTADSRKIGGVHCLCLSVGAIAGHSLTGFLTGDILPASIWDLNWRPTCSPEGMVFSATAAIWVDIYLQSGTAATTRSVNGATITDTRTYWDHGDDLAAVGKRMLYELEFSAIAYGSPEATNIAGGADAVTTGMHRDTTGATNGTSTSAAAPSTDISAAANPQSLTVALNGQTPAIVSFAPDGLNTGALIAAALQVAIRSAIPWAGGLTVTYGATYVISCPGSVGPSASVVITPGAPNDCAAALKLGIANGGVEANGNLGKRIISNCGCEDATGVMWQWVDGGHVYRNHDSVYSGAWSYKSTSGRGQQYTQGADGAIGLQAGGACFSGSSCGSRSRIAGNARSYTFSFVSSRGCARNIEK